MDDFSNVEDTLFVPMYGRIYAGENFPNILNDAKALALKKKLPQYMKGKQTQYTLLAGAVRSTNMDRYIRDFLKRNPDGIIAQLGCGLETTFYRNDNGKNQWYEIDLPDVIEYRRVIMGETERDNYIAADALKEDWIRLIREKHPDAPVLVTASGLFYYFKRDQVYSIVRNLKKYGNIEMVFDTVNSSGSKQMTKYMKIVGHEDVATYFYVDRGEDMARETGTVLLKEEPYYAHTDKKGLKFTTAVTMKVSDVFNMVKMIHIKVGR